MEKMISVALSALILILPGTGSAQGYYRTEISAVYDRVDWKDNTLQFHFLHPTEPVNSRTIGYGPAVEMFFTQVSTADHPYAEAAFLERNGSVTLKFERLELKSAGEEGTGDELLFLIKYAKPDFPLVLQASIDYVKIDSYSPSQQDKLYNSTLGMAGYFNENWLAGFDLDYLYKDNNEVLTTAESDKSIGNVLRYGLFTKYVHELDSGTSFSLQARIGETTSPGKHQSVSAVYYWTRSLSSGVGYQNTSGESLEMATGRTYSGTLQYFFTPSFLLNGVYDRFLASDARNPFGDSKAFSVTLGARF